MTKFLKIFCIILSISLVFSGCSWFGAKKPTPTNAPVIEEDPDQIYAEDGTPIYTTAPHEDLPVTQDGIIGKWKFSHVENPEGEIYEANALKAVNTPYGDLMYKTVKNDEIIEFTKDRKIKFGSKVVEYDTVKTNTIHLKEGKDLSEKAEWVTIMTIGDMAAISVGDYIVVLKRA